MGYATKEERNEYERKRRLVVSPAPRTPEQKAARAEWQRRRNEESPRVALGYRLKSTYGITLEQYDAMWESCKGLCEICLSPLIKAGEPKATACLDHCHTSGKVRGILCRLCNSFLGKVNDNLESTSKYLGGMYARP